MAPGDLDVRNVPASITEGLDGRGVYVAFADLSVWYLRKDVPLEDLKKFFSIEGARKYDRDKLLRPYLIHKIEPPPPAIGPRTSNGARVQGVSDDE